MNHADIVAAVSAGTTSADMQPAGFGTTAGGSVLGIVILGGAVWYVYKHKGARALHLVAAFALGVMLGGSALGLMVHSTVGGATASLTNVVGTVAH